MTTIPSIETIVSAAKYLNTKSRRKCGRLRTVCTIQMAFRESLTFPARTRESSPERHGLRPTLTTNHVRIPLTERKKAATVRAENH